MTKQSIRKMLFGFTFALTGLLTTWHAFGQEAVRRPAVEEFRVSQTFSPVEINANDFLQDNTCGVVIDMQELHKFYTKMGDGQVNAGGGCGNICCSTACNRSGCTSKCGCCK